MQRHAIRSLVVLGIFLVAWSPAIAAEQFNSGALPADRASLERLNELHLGIVRAAVRQCKPTSLPADTNPGAGCIGTSVEQRVAQSGDPQLKAFNAKLPARIRYDENRTNVDLDRTFRARE